MSLTKSGSVGIGTIIVVALGIIALATITLLTSYIVSSESSRLEDSSEPARPIMRGPNPDGSWGEYIEYTRPLVKVTGAQVNKATREVTIFMVVDVGIYGKYSTHITLPLDDTIEEE